MADIFDRIAIPQGGAPQAVPRPAKAKGGDIFDRLATGPTGGDLAPDESSPFVQTVKGLWNAVNPFPAIMQAGSDLMEGKDPIAEMVFNIGEAGRKQRQLANDPKLSRTERFGRSLAADVPLLGPAAARLGEGWGEGLANWSQGGQFPWETMGETAGTLSPFNPFGKRTVPGVIADQAARVGPALERSAVTQYERALGPTGLKNKKIAQGVAREGLERGISAWTDEGLHRKAAAGKAEMGARLDPLEQGIIDRQQAAKVQTKLTGQHTSGQVFLHPAQQVVDFLDQMRHDPSSGTVVNNIVVDPVADAAISRYQNVAKQMGENDPFGATYGGRPFRSNTQLGAISEGALLRWRRALDEMIQNQHVQIPGTNEFAPLSVTRPLSNHLREMFNSTHPDFAQAFRDWKFFNDFEMLTNRKGILNTGAQGTGNQLATNAAVNMIAHGKPGAAVAWKLLHKAGRSTFWRTVPQVYKFRLADAMASGRFTQAAQMLNSLGVALSAEEQAAPDEQQE